MFKFSEKESLSAKRLGLAALSAASAVAIVACGGGGGGGAGAPAPAPPPAPAPAPVIGKATPMSYADTSWEKSGWEYMRTVTQKCNLQTPQPVIELNESANGHRNWVALNGTIGPDAHTQVFNTPGFTGLTPRERGNAAGFLLDEGTGEISSVGRVIEGATRDNTYIAMAGLLFAPYHQAQGLLGFRYVGSSAAKEGGYVVTLGQYNRDSIPKGQVRPFPCDGLEDVPALFGAEIPNPTIDPAGSAKYGPGLTLLSHPDDALVVQSLTVREVGTTVNLTLEQTRQLGNQRRLNTWMPTAWLKGGASYTYEWVYTLNGVAGRATGTFKVSRVMVAG